MSTLSSMVPRTQARIDYEPKAVNIGTGGGRAKRRHQRHGHDNREKPRSRQKENPSHISKYLHRSTHQPVPNSTLIDQTSFVLDVVRQPSKTVQLGVPIEIAIVLSLRRSSFDSQPRRDTTNTSYLLAAASLVAESRHGERVPLQAGYLTAPALFDSIHPFCDQQFGFYANDPTCWIILGYVSFSGLLIRQPGLYRIRTTLIQMGAKDETGACSVIEIDTQPIRVERGQ